MKTEQSMLTPSQVGQYIKSIMDRDRVLSGLLVQGELSNYKLYPSGHHYFTLKDAEGALRCVMFRGDAASLRFRPQNGMQVVAAGRVSAFPRDGQYQLYCVRLSAHGAGDLHVAFEQLKEKLQQQGLFDPAHKKPLPLYPKTIALITSPAGAAVQDMIRILGQRWPMTKVLVLPVRVQGEGAAQEIASAISWANWQQVAEVIITGRGGGSMEDLWAFNEEIVAKAIFTSQIPVISAVGHEPDVTIADFIADVRAATPSNGAQLAVPDQSEIEQVLRRRKGQLEQAVGYRLSNSKKTLAHLARSRALTDPAAYFREKRLLLDYQSRRLTHGLAGSIGASKQRLAGLAAAIDALSPLKVLGRGYAIAQSEEGRVISEVEQIQVGEQLALRLSNGSLRCKVEAQMPQGKER